MTKIDLGFKSRYGSPMVANPDKPEDDDSEKETTCYPQMSVEGKAADALVGQGVDAGDTVTALVTFRVVEVEQRVKARQEFGSDREGNSIDLEVVSLESVKITGEEDDKEENAEDAIEGFLKDKGLARKK